MVLAADRVALERVLGDDAVLAMHIVTVREIWLHATRLDLASRPIVSGSAPLADYFVAAMGGRKFEELRVLFLDGAFGLLREETVSKGSVTEVPIYPREIMRRALELGASGLILAHNHPSGNAKASSADMAMTRLVVDAGRALGILLHDHIIVAGSNWTSLRLEGYL